MKTSTILKVYFILMVSSTYYACGMPNMLHKSNIIAATHNKQVKVIVAKNYPAAFTPPAGEPVNNFADILLNAGFTY